jgi:hypothetical protein
MATGMTSRRRVSLEVTTVISGLSWLMPNVKTGKLWSDRSVWSEDAILFIS